MRVFRWSVSPLRQTAFGTQLTGEENPGGLVWLLLCCGMVSVVLCCLKKWEFVDECFDCYRFCGFL